MCEKSKSFVDLCLEGTRLTIEIDDAVDEWHENGGNDLSLREWLGMEVDEFDAWLHEPNTIDHIVAARHEHKKLAAYLEDQKSLPLAARSASIEEAEKVMAWLESNSH